MTRAMKDSGIEWIGKIPEDWNIEYSKRAFQVDKNIAGSQADEYPRLSLSNQGVIERSKYTGGGESPADYATYQIIPEGEFVFNFMGLEQDSVYRRVGIAPISGLVSAGYMKAIHNPKVINAQYGYYFFRFMEQDQLFKPYGTGIRSNLNKQQFLSIPLLLPPLSEQEKIASILDEKVARIDAIIADTKQSIKELKKYKQSLITETVTKGLDKDVPMKDSGIEWIGKIPEAWEVVKGKYIMKKVRDIQKKYQNEDILSLTMNGIKKRDLDNPSGKMPATFDGYQKVYKENLIACLFDIDVTPRCIGLIKYNGLISPAYTQYYVFNDYNNKFIYYFLLFIDNKKIQLSYTKNLRNTITSDEFLKIGISTPSLLEQNKIVKFLDNRTQQIDQLIQDKEVLIAQYEEYKKSMIYEYVTGKKKYE